MKRSHPEAESPKRSAWQQPASCEFCRLKKIRCDKKRPCSNCTSRHLSCRYALSDANTELIENRSDIIIHSDTILKLERHVLDIHDRLKKLEHSLLNGPGTVTNPNQKPLIPRHQRSVGEKFFEKDIHATWENLEAIAASPHSEFEADSRGHRPASDLPLPASVLPARVATRTQHQDFPTTDERDSSHDARKLLVQLPNVYTARLLFQHYVQMLDCLHREIHVPSTRVILETAYTQLSNSQEVSRETLAFFFSIFASSAFHVCHGQSHSACEDLKGTSRWYSVWKETALGLMMMKDEIVSMSVVSLQSISIMLYLIWDSEGQSPTFHALRSIAYMKAVQMKIHRLDADKTCRDGDIVQNEIKRRLWWHLASTDWLVASIPGPQEGIYSFSPKQMRVKYPANLDDEDILPRIPPAEARPEDQPTSMSFFIQRIKFAELCREVIECLQSSDRSTDTPNYELVVQLGDRLRSFQDSLPWFFRMDEQSMNQTAVLASHRPYIIRQKHVLLYGFYSRLGRLHRPFIARGLRDPDFSVSRTVAVSCAENLLRLRDMAEPGDLCPYVRSYSMDQHLFGALMLLAIDIMVDEDEARAQSRKNELMDTCTVLKEKQRSLNPSGNGVICAIDKLMGILQRPGQNYRPHTSSVNDELARHRSGKLMSPRGVETTTETYNKCSAHDNGHVSAPGHVSHPDGTSLQALGNQDGDESWEELFGTLSRSLDLYGDAFSAEWL
ncbi:hypothetical protein TOPH_02908 [Tolypocladium ophioglossoides CBS 100239]|uniref:Zn(2)-C6 fungal-type domain-containing protein n=1 Tax=Tolypocladium ophioglossoides (strain CBS 100239) TaxID=1163406 RepID=A0A0L0NEG1_TOLOC|nr:hypothetical protein TOPH_02908 [Tolypocladium ophioglossoides CBS 100239]